MLPFQIERIMDGRAGPKTIRARSENQPEHCSVVHKQSAVLPDPRDPLQITHRQVDLLRQRIYGLALGYEDISTRVKPARREWD